MNIYKLMAPLNDAVNVNCELIDNPKSSMTQAQSWMRFPNDNHGVMIVGKDESFQHNQSKCKIFLSGIKLKIEFLGKE